jgi:membrane-bound inhibitor of C-type lysozyme
MRLFLLIPACALAACTPRPANDTTAVANEAATITEKLPEASPAPAPLPTVDNRSTARYRCMDGSKITANFDPDNRQVTIVRSGRRLAVLHHQPATSGIAYTGSGYALSGKGEAMTFTAPNMPPLACTAIR